MNPSNQNMVCGNHGKNGAPATWHVGTELKKETEPVMDLTTVVMSATLETKQRSWFAQSVQVNLKNLLNNI